MSSQVSAAQEGAEKSVAEATLAPTARLRKTHGFASKKASKGLPIPTLVLHADYDRSLPPSAGLTPFPDYSAGLGTASGYHDRRFLHPDYQTPRTDGFTIGYYAGVTGSDAGGESEEGSYEAPDLGSYYDNSATDDDQSQVPGNPAHLEPPMVGSARGHSNGVNSAAPANRAVSEDGQELASENAILDDYYGEEDGSSHYSYYTVDPSATVLAKDTPALAQGRSRTPPPFYQLLGFATLTHTPLNRSRPPRPEESWSA